MLFIYVVFVSSGQELISLSVILQHFMFYLLVWSNNVKQDFLLLLLLIFLMPALHYRCVTRLIIIVWRWGRTLVLLWCWKGLLSGGWWWACWRLGDIPWQFSWCPCEQEIQSCALVYLFSTEENLVSFFRCFAKVLPSHFAESKDVPSVTVHFMC